LFIKKLAFDGFYPLLAVLYKSIFDVKEFRIFLQIGEVPSTNNLVEMEAASLNTTGEIDVLHSDSAIDVMANSSARSIDSDLNMEDDIVGSDLTSFHSPVHSPIGNPGYDTSFIDIQGDDELRGRGTPPASKTSHAYSSEAASKVSHAFSSETPLLSSAHTNYRSTFNNKKSPTHKSSTPRDLQKLRKLSSKEILFEEKEISDKVFRYTLISLGINVFLFSAKILVSIQSRSLAVAASAVDSFLDLCSQAIIYYAHRGSQNIDEKKYPVGRSRLEPIGIIVCASLMGIAALQLIWEGVSKLLEGILEDTDPKDLIPNIDGYTIGLLSFAIFVKLLLFFLCNSMATKSDSMMVLAEDHRNDVLSNAMALVTAYTAHAYVFLWWLDPVGGISIAVYICIMWLFVAQEQAAMLEGMGAEPQFLDEVRTISNNFHENMFADWVRAYHFGKRYLVEVEVVLPRNMNVVQAHDISLELQKKIEMLPQVERAFVHVDYMARDEDEHKVPYYSSDDFETESVDLDEEIQVLEGHFSDGEKPPTIYRHHQHIHREVRRGNAIEKKNKIRVTID